MINVTHHAAKDVCVINTPGTHVQRQPRTYGYDDRAEHRVSELLADYPNAEVILVEK